MLVAFNTSTRIYELTRGGAHGRFQLGTTHKLPTNIRYFATGVCGGRQLVAATHTGIHSGCLRCGCGPAQQKDTCRVERAQERAGALGLVRAPTRCARTNLSEARRRQESLRGGYLDTILNTANITIDNKNFRNWKFSFPGPSEYQKINILEEDISKMNCRRFCLVT